MDSYTILGTDSQVWPKTPKVFIAYLDYLNTAFLVYYSSSIDFYVSGLCLDLIYNCNQNNNEVSVVIIL